MSVKRRFEDEDKRLRTASERDDVRDHFPGGCRSFVSPSSLSDYARKRRARETVKERKEKKRRTMETSFVVSAAFWAPVVTESQNDMAVFLAIRVWTEMVADFL